MCRRPLLIFVFGVLPSTEWLCAQFTDPRTYDNAPIGTNQLEIGYAYARSDASIDTSLLVAGAKLNLNAVAIDYTHYFGFLRRLAWVEASVPIGRLDGSVTATNIRGRTTGTGDSSYQLAVLLKGGPALNVERFANFRPTTTVGVSLTITAPTGTYTPSKLLNLGSDRWSFKPEVALSHPFGSEQKWELDCYANAFFYSDNTSFHGVEILRQEPLPGLEGHVSYSFTNSVSASLDTRYSFRGDTFVNGVNQGDPQENFALGSEVNVSVGPKHSLVFEFARALLHSNGPSYTGFAVKYDYIWGKGYD